MNALLRWWMIFCSIITGFVFLCITGMVDFAWNADHSKLSFAALGLFCLVTPFVGYLTNTIVLKKWAHHKKYLQACWFSSDALMAIGMTGTLVGFMMMFSDAMAHLNVNDTDTIKSIIVSLSRGFTTQLITTLVGIVTCTLLRTQLVNLEVSMESDDEGG
jgi:hypothetical protein